MTKPCPLCGKKIEELILFETGITNMGAGSALYSWRRAYGIDRKKEEYYCPKCNGLLFTNGRKAWDFLTHCQRQRKIVL